MEKEEINMRKEAKEALCKALQITTEHYAGEMSERIAKGDMVEFWDLYSIVSALLDLEEKLKCPIEEKE